MASAIYGDTTGKYIGGNASVRLVAAGPVSYYPRPFALPVTRLYEASIAVAVPFLLARSDLLRGLHSWLR